ncbi:RHS repeat domain-containing protein [Microbulbifer sp. SSSA003]
MPVAQVKTTYNEGQVQSTALTYLHTDHLNTPRIATNESEAIVWRWDSDAFGKSEPNADADGDTNQTLVNLRFPGQIKGAEAPQYYNYFRDYDASNGRYLQSDPIGLNAGINTFEYVTSNPIIFVDYWGLEGVIGDKLNRVGPTDQSGRSGRTGSYISEPTEATRTWKDKMANQAASRALGKLTGKLLKVDPATGLIRANPIGFGLGALFYSEPGACQTLTCDKDGDGLSDWHHDLGLCVKGLNN